MTVGRGASLFEFAPDWITTVGLWTLVSGSEVSLEVSTVMQSGRVFFPMTSLEPVAGIVVALSLRVASTSKQLILAFLLQKTTHLP